ncbi:PepSY domain-containing protein [Azospirillum sp.]|uniref:PepSY domain-containing protein n=1 Tax=Azospirillum sp. TaxID=34012 RepID=UPI003D72D7C1
MRTAVASLLIAAAAAWSAAAQTATPAELAPQAQAALQAEQPAPAAAPAAAVPTKPADEVKRQIEKEYGVTVLRIRDLVREDGSPAYAVTVMNPGGDRNSAFEVSTLEVDARTGTLVPQFRHAADGYTASSAGQHDPNRSTGNPAVLRGHTWR